MESSFGDVRLPWWASCLGVILAAVVIFAAPRETVPSPQKVFRKPDLRHGLGPARCSYFLSTANSLSGALLSSQEGNLLLILLLDTEKPPLRRGHPSFRDGTRQLWRPSLRHR